jgi:methionine aminotransferase
MRETPEHYDALPAFFEAKRNHFCALLEGSRFRWQPAQGTFFQMLDYADISNENDVDYATRLTCEVGVASIPVSVFCEESPLMGKLRFCFAKDDATLEEAAKRLCRL